MTSADHGKTEIGGAQSIRRAIAILRVVALGKDSGVALNEVVGATALSRPTVHRIVQALVEEGIVERHMRTGRFSIGQQVPELALARRARSPLEKVAHRYLRSLATDLGDTVFLTAQKDDHSLCLARYIGNFPIQVFAVEVGDRRPLTVGSAGIAILSTLEFLEAEEIVQRLAQRYKRYRIPVATVLKDIVEARKCGYYRRDTGLVPGTKSISVPLRYQGGTRAAITLSAVKRRLSQAREAEIVGKLRKTGAAIQEELLGSGALSARDDATDRGRDGVEQPESNRTSLSLVSRG